MFLNISKSIKICAKLKSAKAHFKLFILNELYKAIILANLA